MISVKGLSVYAQELGELVRAKSVSASNDDLRPCAELVASLLEKRGFETRLLETRGRPVVWGERPGNSRRLLLYNHYDVQPIEPLSAWTTPPFEPSIRQGALFGRGAIDDKGEIVARLAAIDALIAAGIEMPTLRFLIEGEEEIGSPNLRDCLKDNREVLAADGCIWEAGMIDGEMRPVLWLGLRGLVAVELVVRTLTHDAHSGWAHILPNAAWRLTEALATLRKSDGSIAINGFYDGVQQPSRAQIRLLEAMPAEDNDYRREYGVTRFVDGVEGLALRLAVFTPTCNIAGLQSGHIGSNGKTIVPSEARAKIDFRLVPDQDPQAVLRALRHHLDINGFDDVEIVGQDGQRAATIDPDDLFVRLAIKVATQCYGREPVVSPMVGGTGPAAHVREILDVPFVSLGCSYPGGRKHAPDEHIRFDDFERGASCIANLIAAFAVA